MAEKQELTSVRLHNAGERSFDALKVFISYSRADKTAADAIVGSLEAEGFSVTIDYRDLPYGEEWQRELSDFIAASDAVVWLVSPHSIGSKWCNWELGEVGRLSKRLVPIVVAPTDPSTLPASLGKIHLLPALGTYDPAVHQAALIAALLSDRGWLKRATALSEQARQWAAQHRDRSLLLRGTNLHQAERWSTETPRDTPSPPSDVLEFIMASRRRERRGFRTVVGLSVAVALVSLGLAAAAWLFQQQAEMQRIAALGNERRALAGLAEVARRSGDGIGAIKLGLAAWPRSVDEAAPRIPAALETISLALATPGLELIRVTTPADEMVFSPDGSRAVGWWIERGKANDPVHYLAGVWDTVTGRQIARLDNNGESVSGAGFDVSGELFLTWTQAGTIRQWRTADGTSAGPAVSHAVAGSDLDLSVRTARYSRDATTILSLSADNTVRLWVAATGAQIGSSMTMVGDWPGNKINDVVLSPDERTILTTNDKSLAIWDAATQQLLAPPVESEAAGRGVMFSPDSHFALALHFDGRLTLFDARTGQPTASEMSHNAELKGAFFTPDGAAIISWAANGEIGKWDVATRKLLWGALHGSGASGAVLSPDGKRVVSYSDDGTLQLWDAETGASIGVPMAHDKPVTGVRFSADGGRVLSQSEDGSVRLWDAATGLSAASPMQVDVATVGGAMFDGDGQRIVAWARGVLKSWPARIGLQDGPTLQNDGSVDGTVLSRDGSRLLSWSGNGQAVTLWGAETGRQIGATMRHDGQVNAAMFGPDETTIISSSSDGTIKLWDARTAEPIGRPMTHDGVLGVGVLPSLGQIVSWSWGDTVRRWSLSDQQEILPPIVLDDDDLPDVLVLPGTSRLLSRTNRSLAIWDLTTGQIIAASSFGDDVGEGVVLNGDGSLLSSWTRGHVLQVWRTDNLAPVGPPIETTTGFEGIAFSPDSARLVSWDHEGQIDEWDITIGARVGAPMLHDGVVRGARFSPGGDRIMSWASDRTVRQWDSDTGQSIGLPMRHAGDVEGALYVDDARRMMSWAWDGTVHLWDSVTGLEIVPPLRFGDAVSGAIPTGGRVLAWSHDGTIRFWNTELGPGGVLDIACSRLQDLDFGDIDARYGVSIAEPICTPEQLAAQ